MTRGAASAAIRQVMNSDLDWKIRESKKRIREWIDHWDGQVYVAFSGGKDSTVLLDLVRQVDSSIPAVFCNTGLEFPEIVDFVKQTPDVEIVRPKKSFREVIETYGWPVVSKKTAAMLEKLQNPKPSNEKSRSLYLTGITSAGRKAPTYKLAKKWRYLADAPFPISRQCCEVLKKAPAMAYERRTKRVAFIGTMIGDSQMRLLHYANTGGCNAYDQKRPVSAPMSLWTTENVWEYIRRRGLKYASIYDRGENNTGCVFCCFGVHLEKSPNRFERLQRTHPKLYKYCMEQLGLREVLDTLGVPG